MGIKARINNPELANTTFTVMIRWVSNSKGVVLFTKQLQALNTEARQCEEWVDFINKTSSPKEQYIVTSMFMCTLEQQEWEEEYMGLYRHGHIINDSIYGQMSYNYGLSNAFNWKLGHNVEIIVVEMKRVRGKEIAEHGIRPTKVIPASRGKARLQ